jgi:hypothetical protein
MVRGGRGNPRLRRRRIAVTRARTAGYALLLGLALAGACARGYAFTTVDVPVYYCDADGGLLDASSIECPAQDAGTVIVYEPCEPGASQSCYTAGNAGRTDAGAFLGVCMPGLQTCYASDAGEDAGPGWGPCEGEVTPDPNGNNCSGMDVACLGQIGNFTHPGPPGSPCPVPQQVGADGGLLPPLQGPCAISTWQCAPGSDSPQCIQTVYPTIQLCDGLDDGCTGTINQVLGLGQECNTGLPGISSLGTVQCPAAPYPDGGATICVPYVAPAVLHENCTLATNDANGNGISAAHDSECCCPPAGPQNPQCNIYGSSPTSATCIGQCAYTGSAWECIAPSVPTNNFNVPE